MTLKDVALKANCSVATVSKALKNSSEISEDAKQRILSVARELGYLKKATTRTAVLGGLKTAVFCDTKGEHYELFGTLLPVAKKCGLELIYVRLSDKESVQLMEQIGAFALVIGGSSRIKDDKIFVLNGGTEGVKEFLQKASSYMPLRPSRAVSEKTYAPRKAKAPKNKEQERVKEVETVKEEPRETKREEIWLL